MASRWLSIPPRCAPPSARAETISSPRPNFLSVTDPMPVFRVMRPALRPDCVEFFLVAGDGFHDYLRGDVALLPSDHLYPAPFEILVDEKEVLDLLQRVLRKIGDVEVFLIKRIIARNRENLVVGLATVAHLQHAERTAVDETAGECRLVHEHEYVERVAVLVQRPWNETVLAGIMDRGIQHPIQTDQPRFLVELVLVLAAGGNLHHRRDRVGWMGSGGKIMPGIYHVALRCIPLLWLKRRPRETVRFFLFSESRPRQVCRDGTRVSLRGHPCASPVPLPSRA